jgi:hypothetical protein
MIHKYELSLNRTYSVQCEWGRKKAGPDWWDGRKNSILLI